MIGMGMFKLDTDCIEHEGFRDKGGYGKVSFRRYDPNLPTVWRAHRWAWIEAHGEIPEGKIVRHKCDNPPCINVDHLELGGHSDNQVDCVERGRNSKASKDFCVNGHEFTPENTYWHISDKRRPRRICKHCNADRVYLKRTGKQRKQGSSH